MSARGDDSTGGTEGRTRSRAVLGVALAVLVALAGCSAALDRPDVSLNAESGEHLTFTLDVAVECAEYPPEENNYSFHVDIGGVTAPVVSTDAEQVGETVVETCIDPVFGERDGYTFNATVTLTVVAPDHEAGTYDLAVGLYWQPNVFVSQVEDGEENDGPLGEFVASYWLEDAVVYGDGDGVPDHVDTRDTRRVTNGYDDADRTTMSFKVGIMRGHLSLNADGFGGSEITIDTLERLPPRMASPDGELVSAIDVDLPGAKHVADRSLTVRMPVVMNAGDGYDVDALHVAYYDTAAGEWVTVETTVVDRTVGGGYDVAHLEGEVPYPTTIAVVHEPTDDGGD